MQTYTAGMKQLPGLAYGNPSKLTPTDDKWAEIIEDAPEFIEYYLFPYLIVKYAKENLGYNNKSKDFRRSGSLLYVCTYFMTLVKVLIKSETLNPFEENPLKISRSTLNKLFLYETINKKLLKLADEILEFYFMDSSIQNYVSDDLGNFLKRTIDSKEKKVVRDILSSKIDYILKQNKGIEIIDFFK